MTAPQISLVTGRHGRTTMGIGLMAGSLLYVLGIHVFGGLLHLTPSACAVAWVQVVNEWGFPALLLLAGWRLFDLESFKDVLEVAKGFLPGTKA